MSEGVAGVTIDAFADDLHALADEHLAEELGREGVGVHVVDGAAKVDEYPGVAAGLEHAGELGDGAAGVGDVIEAVVADDKVEAGAGQGQLLSWSGDGREAHLSWRE